MDETTEVLTGISELRNLGWYYILDKVGIQYRATLCCNSSRYGYTEVAGFGGDALEASLSAIRQWHKKMEKQS